MKKITCKIAAMAIILGLSPVLHSQNIAINLSGAASPNSTAILDMSDASNNKLGLLLPNVSLSAISTIAPFTSTPVTGLIVWNTNAAVVGGFGTGFYYYTGTQWSYLQNSGNPSGLTGVGTNNYTARWTSATNLAIGVIQDNGTGAGISGTAITPKSMLDVKGGMSIGTYAGVTAAPANGMIISGQVGIGNNSPNASALLDLSNTSSLAFLPPQMSLSNISTLAPVPGPGPAGLIVYNTNAATVGGSGTGLYYWNGSQWNYLSAGGASGWSTTGNTGTNPAINYAGTSGAQDFVVRTTATERMRFLAGGGAGVGTTTPKSAMDVNGNMSLGAYAGNNAAPANGMIVSGQVGIGTNTPNSSAVLDLTSSSSGLLPPRMTGAQMSAIVSPAIGLMVLNTTTNCMEYWSGVAWQNMVCPCTGPPAAPGTITGNATPCISSSGNVYTIAAVAGATSYTWTLPAGAVITAGTGTNTITVTFGTTSGNITVTASNSCGTSGASPALVITLSNVPNAPAVPAGNTAPLISTTVTYTIAAVAGATTYTWSVSTTNGTVTAGQGTTSAGITFSSTGGTMNICVTAGNGCGTSSPTCLTVTSSSCSVVHTSTTYTYTASMITWVVPCGITSVTFDCYGAQGIAREFTPGNGGEARGVQAVTPGQTYYFFVGGQSLWNGGGSGQNGANGGDGSDVRFGGTAIANRIIVAGGGGGAGGDSWGCLSGVFASGGNGIAVGSNFVGGGGGEGYGGCGTNGGNSGGVGYAGNCHGGGAGGGGLISGGGPATATCGPYTAQAGSLGQGGASYNASGCSSEGAGGGGGGYYGGGGSVGYNCGAGQGGGGSSWTGTLTSPFFAAGVQAGTGKIIVTY